MRRAPTSSPSPSAPRAALDPAAAAVPPPSTGFIDEREWIDPSRSRSLEALSDDARREPAFSPREFPTPGVLSP